MSFLELVYNHVQTMHQPVSAAEIFQSMDKTVGGIQWNSVKEGRAKISKALADLRDKKKSLQSHHNENGILLWSANVKPVELPGVFVQSGPYHKPSERTIMKELLTSIATALQKAADEL